MWADHAGELVAKPLVELLEFLHAITNLMVRNACNQVKISSHDYASYSNNLLSSSNSLLIESLPLHVF